MITQEFTNYREYVRAQVKGSNRRPNRSPAALQSDAELVVAHCGSVSNGMCHGARCGSEVRSFRALFPDAQIRGTDLAPRDESLVFRWDFQKARKDWIGKFDFIYSNALDHACNPEKCAAVWLRQLNQDGKAFIVWTPQHRLVRLRENEKYPGGDCFGAELSEYIELFNRHGKVIDLIYTTYHAGKIRIFVVAQKGRPIRRRRTLT